MQAKVWAQFDAAGPLIGREWPIRYRGTEAERVDRLRAMGVRRFPALSYAHRPGMAEHLNVWAAEFADRTPGCLRSATFFPEPGVEEYVAARTVRPPQKEPAGIGSPTRKRRAATVKAGGTALEFLRERQK